MEGICPSYFTYCQCTRVRSSRLKNIRSDLSYIFPISLEVFGIFLRNLLILFTNFISIDEQTKQLNISINHGIKFSLFQALNITDLGWSMQSVMGMAWGCSSQDYYSKSNRLHVAILIKEKELAGFYVRFSEKGYCRFPIKREKFLSAYNRKNAIC